MPAKSPAQERLMQAAAHTPGGFGGVPQSVGREFVGHSSPKSKEDHMARRSKVVGQRATGKEFGVHQSTVSRKMRKQGYERLG